MKHRNLTICVLAVLLLEAADPLHAQSEQRPENLLEDDEVLVPEETVEAEEPEAPASGVVDVSEENFRRSMELEDRTIQRSPDLTTGSYSRGTGLQALDDLPEESQKHLRGQLREVIVENGPWTPDDAGAEYPFIASEEAANNPSLQRREKAAWGEMVQEYHEREAAIHANASRTQAASRNAEAAKMAATGSQSSGAQQAAAQAGNPGTERSESEDQGDNPERQAALRQLLNSDDAAPASGGGGQPPPVVPGAEQNALELLTRRQQIPPGSQARTAPSISAVVSGETSQSSQDASGSGEQDQELALETEGVIAIEDLKKVRANPDDSDNRE